MHRTSLGGDSTRSVSMQLAMAVMLIESMLPNFMASNHISTELAGIGLYCILVHHIIIRRK